MSNIELATPEMFGQFNSTQHYYSYDHVYVFTDRIKYLQDHIFNFISFTFIIQKNYK